jgi:hypothetical protein
MAMKHDDDLEQRLIDALYEGHEVPPELAAEAERLKAFRGQVQRHLARREPSPGLRRNVLAEARRRTARERAPWFTWAVVPAMAAAAFVLVWLGVRGVVEPPGERLRDAARVAQAPPRAVPEPVVTGAAPAVQPARPAGEDVDRLLAVGEKEEQAAHEAEGARSQTRARVAAEPRAAAGKAAAPAPTGGGGWAGHGRAGGVGALGTKGVALEKKTLEALGNGGVGAGDALAGGTAGVPVASVLADESGRAEPKAKADQPAEERANKAALKKVSAGYWKDASSAEDAAKPADQSVATGSAPPAASAPAAEVVVQAAPAKAPAQPVAGPAPVACAGADKAWREAKTEQARVDAALALATCLRDAGQLDRARDLLTRLLGEASLSTPARQRLARELLRLAPPQP